MFDTQAYLRVLTSISAAVTTLLGSVGIFVSLTVQRRIERLQDVLEEFLDLSYHSDTNLTGKMFNLIEKYQMHYLFPDNPGRMILYYIDFTIFVVVVLWFSTLLVATGAFAGLVYLLYLIPVLLGLSILVLYRYLLKNAVYPFGNHLMRPLIPPPYKLRSVSFLSSYVNVSVKSILRQARLRVIIRRSTPGGGVVILKEELSFDDYVYYFLVTADQEPIFAAYGELMIKFGSEPITGKPIPAAKNVSIPLGSIPDSLLSAQQYEARLFVFPRGEKHPLEYVFHLQAQGDIIAMADDPEISVNYMVTYQIDKARLQIMEENTQIPFLQELFTSLAVNQQRFSCCCPFNLENTTICREEIYID